LILEELEILASLDVLQIYIIEILDALEIVDAL